MESTQTECRFARFVCGDCLSGKCRTDDERMDASKTLTSPDCSSMRRLVRLRVMGVELLFRPFLLKRLADFCSCRGFRPLSEAWFSCAKVVRMYCAKAVIMDEGSRGAKWCTGVILE